MSRVLVFVLALFALGHTAYAQTPQTMDALSSGAPFGKNDIFTICKNGSSCGTLAKAKVSDLDTYLNAVQVTCANDATNDPTNIDTALATGKPVHISGTCNFTTTTTPRVLATQGQIVFGDGMRVTTINVGTNTGIATGVFQCTTGAPTTPTGDYTLVGPTVKNLSIVFTQVNTATRASLRNFSPAFYMQDCLHFTIDHVQMDECMICVDARGNTGQSSVIYSRLSPLATGIWIDGNLDITWFNHNEFFPFGAELMGNPGNPDGCNTFTPTNLCLLFQKANLTGGVQTTSGTAGPIGIYSGCASGWWETDDLFLLGQAVVLVTGSAPECTYTSTYTRALIQNTGMDSFGGIDIHAGEVQASNSYFQTSGFSQFGSIGWNQTGGRASCTGCTFFSQNQVAINVQGGSLSLSIPDLYNRGNNQSVECETACVLDIQGGFYHGDSDANGAILVNFSTSGSVATIMGMRAVDTASGGGHVFLNIKQDNAHRILGNAMNGSNWVNACPGTQATMKSGFNGSGANATCN